MTKILRDYQLKTQLEIDKALEAYLNPLVVLSTGAGKSLILADYAYQRSLKGHHFVFAVRKRGLVENLAKTFEENNFNYSVFMANDKRYNKKCPIQICSIDTITSRKIYPHRWVEKVTLVIDEADESKGEGYQEFIKAYTNRASLAKPWNVNSKIKNANFIGMTATPYNGLSHFDKVIVPITAKELNDRGILVDFDYWIPKSSFDISDIQIKAGNYVTSQVDFKLNNVEAYKATLSAWQEHGDFRKTLVFCSSVNHSEKFTNWLNQYFGKQVAVHLDANTSDENRYIAIKRFREKDLVFLVSVGILRRGVDIPEIGLILDGAPTVSINNHIQKLGRGSRQNEYYKNVKIIDMVGNLIRHGHFYQEREIDLSQAVKFDRHVEQMSVCSKCFRATDNMGQKRICPFCGFTQISKAKNTNTRGNQKVEVAYASEEKLEQIKIIKDYKKKWWYYHNIKQYDKIKASFSSHMKLFDLYGLTKMLKVKRSIFLKERTIQVLITKDEMPNHQQMDIDNFFN